MPMSFSRDWWFNRPDERYWCEVTERDDLGANLRCPQRGEGSEFWGYSIINEIRPGDIVFHYRAKAILGASIAGGPIREDQIMWKARGTAGRARPEPLGPQPGWLCPLQSFTPLTLTLDEMRADEAWVRDWIGKTRRPLRIPFVIQANELQGFQTYIGKFPAAFVAKWQALAVVAARLGVPPLAELSDEPTSNPEQLANMVDGRRRQRRSGRGLAPPRANDSPARIATTSTTFARLASVVEHVLARAGGTCEACGAPAPFWDVDDEPFLEVHHVVTLANGGPDRIENAVALCPNCHRALHHAKDRDARRERLYDQVPALRRF